MLEDSGSLIYDRGSRFEAGHRTSGERAGLYYPRIMQEHVDGTAFVILFLHVLSTIWTTAVLCLAQELNTWQIPIDHPPETSNIATSIYLVGQASRKAFMFPMSYPVKSLPSIGLSQLPTYGGQSDVDLKKISDKVSDRAQQYWTAHL